MMEINAHGMAQSGSEEETEIVMGGSWWKYEDYLVEAYSQPIHHDTDQTVIDDVQYSAARTQLQCLLNHVRRLLKGITRRMTLRS